MADFQTINLWPESSPHHHADDLNRARIDIYHPARKAASPTSAVIVCPGGGYTHRAPHEGEPFAQLFTSNNMLGIVCHYRVRPHAFPAAYSDAARAVRYVRHNAAKLNIDPNRIALMGFSAGGHNAALLATQPQLHIEPLDDLAPKVSALPNRLILGYAALSWVHPEYLGGSPKVLLGSDATPEERQKLSPTLHVSPQTPPTFLFHTAEDPVVPADVSLEFASACHKHKVPYEIHVYEKGRHGLGLAESVPATATWPPLLLNWLRDWT